MNAGHPSRAASLVPQSVFWTQNTYIMNLVGKLFDTTLDQVLEFLEVPPPLVHAWSQQKWFDVSMAGASFVPHIVLVRIFQLNCHLVH